MTENINKAWKWKGIVAKEIIDVNDFGNVIFLTEKNEYWRICPEELSCKKVASTKKDWEKLKVKSDFIEDWRMTSLVECAKNIMGELKADEKYYLKIPSVLGGAYNESNIGKISFSELIAFCGDTAFQIKDLEDGQKVTIKITD